MQLLCCDLIQCSGFERFVGGRDVAESDKAMLKMKVDFRASFSADRDHRPLSLTRKARG
jgi:hypothetical protein